MVKSISSFTFHFFKKAGLLWLTPRNDVIFPLPLRERARVRGNSSLRATFRNRIVATFYNSTFQNDMFIIIEQFILHKSKELSVCASLSQGYNQH